MGFFDSKSSTKSTDLSDKSNSSAGNDLTDIGQVSGKKNTQNVDLSRIDDAYNTDISDAYNTNLSGAYAGNSGTLTVTDGGAIDAMQKTVEAFSRQSTKNLETTQALAQSVSSGGQTVVAESSVKMIKYVSSGVAVAAALYLIGSIIKAKAK